MLDIFPSRAIGPFGRRQRQARGGRIPVIVITGFLGAGKTTLVRNFLATPEGAGTAIVVNEFGEEGIDDALLRTSTDQVALLGNGCMCCTSRTDPAGDTARPRGRPRARPHPAFQARHHRDLGARRSRPGAADLRHRPRARRRVSPGAVGGAGGRGQWRRYARLVGGGPQAGDPRRPAARHQDRSCRRGRRARSGGAPARAQTRWHPSARLPTA